MPTCSSVLPLICEFGVGYLISVWATCDSQPRLSETRVAKNWVEQAELVTDVANVDNSIFTNVKIWSSRYLVDPASFIRLS